jgi:hypothetical protein
MLCVCLFAERAFAERPFAEPLGDAAPGRHRPRKSLVPGLLPATRMNGVVFHRIADAAQLTAPLFIASRRRGESSA